jgi:ABC-2 type transport system ATP-binding protein
MNSELAIEAKGITKSYGKRTILKDINLRVKKGSVFAVLGPNGAGKTTAVRILSTLTKLDSGEAYVAGHALALEVGAIRSKISLTGQYAAVDEKLTGRENMSMIGELCGINKKETKERTQQLLAQFDLLDDADKISGTYSGGMRRKLDLAMSLINSPEIIFLDEPTTGLDPRSRRAMWEIIGGLRKKGVTIFLTTQYLEEADQLADTIIVIDDGVVVAEGTPEELKRRVGDRSLQLTFATRKEAEVAASLFKPGDVLSKKGGVTVSIKTDGSVAHTKKVMDTLHAAGSNPSDMTFHAPSLDEVFFALTGNNDKKKDDSHENEAI